MGEDINLKYPRRISRIAAGIALGVGIGAGLGASGGDMGRSVAGGVALGVVFAVLVEWYVRQDKRNRTYMREFLPAMAAYMVVLPFSVSIVRQMNDHPLRYVVALLPVLPIALTVVAYIRHLRRLDELQQRIQIEALAVSVGATGLLTFALGLLEPVGVPPLSMILVFPLLIFFWGFSGALANRRYR